MNYSSGEIHPSLVRHTLAQAMLGEPVGRNYSANAWWEDDYMLATAFMRIPEPNILGKMSMDDVADQVDGRFRRLLEDTDYDYDVTVEEVTWSNRSDDLVWKVSVEISDTD